MSQKNWDPRNEKNIFKMQKIFFQNISYPFLDDSEQLLLKKYFDLGPFYIEIFPKYFQNAKNIFEKYFLSLPRWFWTTFTKEIFWFRAFLHRNISKIFSKCKKYFWKYFFLLIWTILRNFCFSHFFDLRAHFQDPYFFWDTLYIYNVFYIIIWVTHHHRYHI